MTLDAFASRYHWTPDQVDALPQTMAEELPMLWKAQASARRAGQLAATATALAYQQVAPKGR